MVLSILSNVLSIVYYLLMIYYALIVIYFILTWIRPLYGTKFFSFMYRITNPFMRIFSGKLILGGFDLGGTIGLLLYGLLLSILQRIIYMV